MSFLTEIQKENYEPIYLVQCDVLKKLSFSTTKHAFLYVTSFLNAYDWIDPEFLAGTTTVSVIAVGSVRVGGIYLKQVFSIADGDDNRETFYFDLTEKKLYLHCPDGNNPYLFDVQYGVVFGFRKGGGDKAYWNDIYYDDIVLSIPSITRSKTDYFNARNINESGEVVLGNDGTYDKWAEDDTILGNSIRIFVGFPGFDFADFELTSVGYVKLIKVQLKQIIIEMKDKKERLKNPVPENTFEIADYPYLDDNNIGKVAPLLYGPIRNLPVVCVNETEFDYNADSRPVVPETLTFKIADMTYYASLHDVSAVYVYDGDGHKTNVTAFATINLITGSFTITSDYYVPGQKVTIDVEGYEDTDGNLISNALDIIRDLLIYYASSKFNNIYFNISRWDRARAFNTGIAVTESTSLDKIIEDITQGGTLANFQVDDDDRYSCRIFNKAAPVDLVINSWDILNEIEIEYDQEKLVAELLVNYNKDWENDKYSTYLDASYKTVNNDLYQTYFKKTIDTLLASSADAASFAAAFLDIYGNQYRTFTLLTGLIACRQEISNIIQIELKRPDAPNIGIAKCEVIGHNKDFDSAKVSLDLRIFDLILPQIWSEGVLWYDFAWYDAGWDVGMYVDDLTA